MEEYQIGSAEYLKMGFKAIRLKGYHSRFNKQRDYKIAKQAVDKGFTNADFKGLSLSEIEQAEKQGYWTGWLVPEGYIVIDSENPAVIALLDNIARELNCTVQKTTNGKQYMFRYDKKNIPAASEYFCIGGFPVTPRISGKNYVIMPPINNRTWEQWTSPEKLPELPDILYPHDTSKKEQIALCLAWSVGEAYREKQLTGYDDIDLSFMALLIEAGISVEDINVCFRSIFRTDYDAERTDSMYNRYKEKKALGEKTIGPGLFINRAKDSELKEISKWIKKLGKFTVTSARETSPKISSELYFTDEQGYLCKRKTDKNNSITVYSLANFVAEIFEEITEDDGNEITRKYRIGGLCRGKELPSIEIPAAQFPSMNWIHHYGNRAIIEPGNTIKDTVRHAIQSSSRNIQYTNAYTHTGWRKIDGNMVFLSHGSAIGGNDVTVQLSKEAARYSIPVTPENEIEAILASISLLNIGNRNVTLPFFTVAYIAPLTSLFEKFMPLNFSFYSYGQTGTFKTTLAVLLLCHYGKFNASSLPNLEDTANSVERKAFILKDVLMVMDDYHPTSSRKESYMKDSLVQRVIREFSNRTGRGRLNSDAKEKGRYSPRGILLITGEEITSLQSTIARIFVIEINKGDVDIEKLTQLQGMVDKLPHAMSSFINWLLNNMPDIQKKLPSRFSELRKAASKEAGHLKLPEQVAFMTVTLEVVSSWLVDKGIFTEKNAALLVAEGFNVFRKLTERHGERIREEDPLKKFEDIILNLLRMEKIELAKCAWR